MGAWSWRASTRPTWVRGKKVQLYRRWMRSNVCISALWLPKRKNSEGNMKSAFVVLGSALLLGLSVSSGAYAQGAGAGARDP